MNDNISARKSTATYNGIMVETMVYSINGYEKEYISDRRYDAYCHWCRLFKNGDVDYATVMEIIKGDNLGMYYRSEDFQKKVEQKPTIVKTVAQERISSLIETYTKKNSNEVNR